MRASDYMAGLSEIASVPLSITKNKTKKALLG
jgi:hypothetical protein